MKKLVCIILALGLMLTMLSSCGSDNGQADQTTTASGTTQGSASTEGATPKLNEFGWEVPEKTLEITFLGGQLSQTDMDKFGVPGESKYDKFLLEKFNMKITRMNDENDRAQRLTMMLASGTYPEVVALMLRADFDKWISMGKLQNLTPLIEQYGPNVKSAMGDLLGRFKSADGNVYGIPDGWGSLPVAAFGASVRYDWYQEIGAPSFSTPDEYYDVLKKLVEKHPQNKNGEKVFALGEYKVNGNYTRPYTRLGGFWGLQWDWKTGEDNSRTYWINTDEGLQFTKWLNKVYREGMLDPDSFTQLFEDWGARVMNERYAGSIVRKWENSQYGAEKWQKSYGEAYDDNMRYVLHNMKIPEIESATLTPDSTTGYGFTAITDKCKQPEAVMKWFDYMNTPWGARVFGWGLPNEADSVWNSDPTDYKKFTWNETVKNAIIDQTVDWDKLTALGYTQYGVVYPNQQFPDGTCFWVDSVKEIVDANKWRKVDEDNVKGTVFDNTAAYLITFPADDPVATIRQTVFDIADAGFATAVMSKTEAQCEQEFMKMREKANKAGLKDFEAYVTKEYKRILDSWK